MKENMQNSLQKTRKVAKIAFVALFVLGLAVFAFFYFGNYSDENVVAGRVIKISRQGVLFKTWEGELKTSPVVPESTPEHVAPDFIFSVASGDENVLKDLQAAAVSGDRIAVRYVEKYFRVLWRGETKYFVKSVEQISLSDTISAKPE